MTLFTLFQRRACLNKSQGDRDRITNTGVTDDEIKTQNPHDGWEPGLDLGELSTSRELMCNPPSPLCTQRRHVSGWNSAVHGPGCIDTDARMWIHGHGCLNVEAWTWVHERECTDMDARKPWKRVHYRAGLPPPHQEPVARHSPITPPTKTFYILNASELFYRFWFSFEIPIGRPVP